MPLTPRLKRAHEKVILNQFQLLKKNHPENDVQPNSNFRHKHYCVPDMDKLYYPDILDRTDLKAYEVHVAGKRKEEEFAQLPNGWTGVNVFVVDIWEQDEVFVWNLNNQYVHITRDSWQSL